MVSPPEIDTAFRRAARRLPPPVAGRFDPEAWRRTFSTAEHPTDDDRRFFEATLWLGSECRALADQQAPPFESLCAADAVILGVARLNLEFRTAAMRDDEIRDAMSPDEIVSFDYWSHLRHENDYGQRMSFGDYMEAAIEALEPWLYDARRLPAPRFWSRICLRCQGWRRATTRCAAF